MESYGAEASGYDTDDDLSFPRYTPSYPQTEGTAMNTPSGPPSGHSVEVPSRALSGHQNMVHFTRVDALLHLVPTAIYPPFSDHCLVVMVPVAISQSSIASFGMSALFPDIATLPAQTDSSHNHANRTSTEWHDEGVLGDCSQYCSNPFWTETDPVETCSICLEDLHVCELVSVIKVCGHHYHSTCLDKWLGRCARCPICRRDVRSPHVTTCDNRRGLWN